jgi:hypothetical protein
MSIDLTPWFDNSDPIGDRLGARHFKDARIRRFRVVDKIQADLAAFAQGLGQTEVQTAAKLEELFSTFPSQWALYLLVGSSAINTAIANDATIGWLDADANGQTVRARLLNRLS